MTGRILIIEDSADLLEGMKATLEDEGFEVRKLIFGDYLVFYRIDDRNRVVEVLDFRHDV